MGVKGQRKGRIRSGENGPVQMYDGRIHLPLSLVNQHLQGVTFPYHLTGIYHITRGSQTIVHEVRSQQRACCSCALGACAGWAVVAGRLGMVCCGAATVLQPSRTHATARWCVAV